MIDWMHTRVWQADYLDEMRASIARNLAHMNWRRHGIGCVQGYLREGDDHEVRVHVWHPSIVREGMEDHGDYHNHRFRMVSTVLTGTIIHSEAELHDDPNGEWNVYHVVHAREDIGARYQQDRAAAVPGGLESEGRRVILEPRTGYIGSGQSYEFDRGAFHRTRVDGLTVTVVSKYDQTDDRARIVAKPEPVHAFEPDDTFDPTAILEVASAALLL